MTWVVGGIILGGLVIFDEYVVENAEWLRWFAFAALIIASIVAGPPKYDAGRSRLAATVEAAPWLKWWAGLCAIVCFGGAIYLLRSPYRLEDLFGSNILIIALILLVGPIVAVNERRRYQELGRANAI